MNEANSLAGASHASADDVHAPVTPRHSQLSQPLSSRSVSGANRPIASSWAVTKPATDCPIPSPTHSLTHV